MGKTRIIKKIIPGFGRLLLLVTVLFNMGNAVAAENTLESITYSTLPGNRLQIVLGMTSAMEKPLSFTIDNPARIAFDFPGTISSLPKRSQPIGVGIAQSITAITAKDKTRVILNLTEVVPYSVSTEGSNVLITLDSESTSNLFAAGSRLRLQQHHNVSTTYRKVSAISISVAAKTVKAELLLH
jgi:type IV pilus assembly protein PilQ